MTGRAYIHDGYRKQGEVNQGEVTYDNIFKMNQGEVLNQVWLKSIKR